MISATEIELLGFFNVIPLQLYADSEWPYNEFCYLVEQEGRSLSFLINPGYIDVHIQLSSAGEPLYEYRASLLQDVKYRREKGVERLEVIVSDGEWLTIILEPHISIRHIVETAPA